MRVLETDFAQDFIRMCEDGWLQGWHECHAGNLSYRLTGDEAALVRQDLRENGDWVPMDVCAADLAGEYFLVTASGSFFRHVARKPESCLGIVKISQDGASYARVWGFQGGGKPTSELPAHLMNHAVKKRVSGGENRVIYHAHPSNIIALSFVLPPEDRAFTRELWEMEPECAMTFPAGIGVLPWMVPGQREIAELSGALMERYDVILWAQHGLFSAGKTLDEAFGLTHTVEKAAEMLLKVMATGIPKQRVASPDDFRAMAQAFHLNLPQRFLDDIER